MRPASRSCSARCSTRATRSTRTRRARPRTRRRRRSGSSTRRPTRRRRPSTFDKLRMQGIARADGDAVLTGEVRFLQGAGDDATRRCRGASRRRGATLADLAGDAARGAASSTAACTAACGCGRRPRRRPLARDALRAQHDAGRPRAWTAPSALRREPALHASGPRGSTAGASSRRCEARRRARESVNTFPVLATDGRRRAARRGDHAARPPAARAREPRRPLRRHRDRGGAAAARPRALRRRARGDHRGRTRPCAR